MLEQALFPEDNSNVAIAGFFGDGGLLAGNGTIVAGYAHCVGTGLVYCHRGGISVLCRFTVLVPLVGEYQNR